MKEIGKGVDAPDYQHRLPFRQGTSVGIDIAGTRLDGLTLDEAARVVQRFRRTLGPLLDRRRATEIARLITRELDASALDAPLGVLHDANPEIGVMRSVTNWWKDSARASRDSVTHDYSGTDDSCEVVLFPSTGGTLAMIFTQVREFERLWKDLPEVREYWWTNRSDPDEHVSPADWASRGHEWEEALKSGGTEFLPPSVAGFTSATTEPMLVSPPEQTLLAHQPGLDTRITFFAQERLREEFIAGAMRNRSTGPAAASTREITKRLFEFQEWKKTPEGGAAHNALYTKIAALIPREWTSEDFRTPILTMRSPEWRASVADRVRLATILPATGELVLPSAQRRGR